MLDDPEIRLLELFAEHYGQPETVKPHPRVDRLTIGVHSHDFLTRLTFPVDGYTLADREFEEVPADDVWSHWDIHIITVYPDDRVVVHLETDRDEPFEIEDER